MSSTKEQKSKVTYTRDQWLILYLKEAFKRDLNLFIKLTQDSTPKDWTLTVVTNGSDQELIVNVPPKKQNSR